MPDFTPAVETLLRTIHAQGAPGATFQVMPRARYRLAGTDYVVSQRTFYPLTGDGYVTDGGDDSAPVRLTAKGLEWTDDHPVPRGGSRGPYFPDRARRPRSPRWTPASEQRTAYSVVKDQFEENGMRFALSPVYARAVLAMHDLETANRLEEDGFPEAAASLRVGRQALVDEAFGPEGR
ncbi:hypothetical protein M2271_007254 [Streptomyces sp. LBL]|uniref:hypothetical protein n=1 Tax=Streptomyces sp. LBL TaxID=2940562 RepID=UPI00247628E7|nr:hypothetical protein [Streptomyces sp. LBL]MDH6629418.1 hypothetical protein [Streptomyces sp. LBL]